jgi:hypothetical protein
MNQQHHVNHGRVWAKVALHVLAIVAIDVAETSIAKAHAALRRGRALMGIAAHLRTAAEEIGAREEQDPEPIEPPARDNLGDDLGGEKQDQPPTVACGDYGDDRPFSPSFPGRWPWGGAPVPAPWADKNGPTSGVRSKTAIDMTGQ